MATVFVGLILIGSIIVLANMYDAGQFNNRIAMKGILILLSSLMPLFGGMILLLSFSEPDATLPAESNIVLDEVSSPVSWLFFLFCLVLGIFCLTIVFSRSARTFLHRYIIQAGGISKCNHPASVVHILAIVLMCFASVFTVGNFILIGGIEGLADSLVEINQLDLWANLLLYSVLSVLGVGLFIRRNISRTILRLGIRLPQNGEHLDWLRNGIKHLVIGAFVGFGMFWLQIGMAFIWQLLVPPETLAAQSAASQALFIALSGSLWLGFLVAFTAGVGEELLFRGALQPIFGNVIVSIFFVMMHSQYILTPASIIIFIVSLVFGFLRTRYTTPAAMMAHFVYNFTPFVIITVLAQYGVPPEMLGF